MSDARTLEARIAAALARMPAGAGGRRLDRRAFFVAGGATVAAFLAACNSEGPRDAQPLLDRMERANEGVERAIFRHTSMDMAGHRARDAASAFPVYYIADTIPMWDAAERGPWTLEVSGLVGHPVRLTLDELMHMPRVTQRVDHFCVEGWNAVATWTGVRVSDLAALVRPAPNARYVDFQSFDDDYHESWDLASAMHPQTLIAYGMDGAMLGAAHGGPARLHSPVKLGYKNTKYLTKVVFMAERNGGYWSDRGYEWYGGV